MSDLATNSKAELYRDIRDVLLSARTQVRQTVNTTMVQSYWQIGRLIVEDEQGGQKRAEYGKRVLPELAKRLAAEFGKGFSLPNLRNFRQFYLNFSMDEIRYTASSELSWSHYCCLIRETTEAAVESVTLTLLNLERPSAWDEVSHWIDTHGEIANRQLRDITKLDTLEASRMLRNWVAQGLLVALPAASRQQARYTKPVRPVEPANSLSNASDNELSEAKKPL